MLWGGDMWADWALLARRYDGESSTAPDGAETPTRGLTDNLTRAGAAMGQHTHAHPRETTDRHHDIRPTESRWVS